MSHPAQVQFCNRTRQLFPDSFHNVSVIDFGSLDINGNNRQFFTQCRYLGVDIGPGANVDIVGRAHDLNIEHNSIDTVISTEMLEHDPFWKDSLKQMFQILKPRGLLVFTCAGVNRREHGTYQHYPGASPLTISQGWNYYRNVTASDLLGIWNLEEHFIQFSVSYQIEDLQFWGIKR